MFPQIILAKKKKLAFYKVCEKLLSYKTKNVRNFVAYDIFVMFISMPYFINTLAPHSMNKHYLHDFVFHFQTALPESTVLQSLHMVSKHC